MADKLDWLNQHPLWFIYPSVSEVVTLNHLNLSTPLQRLAERFPLSEDFLKALWHDGQCKDACTFCAYNTNPRVAVWWAYSCVVDLSRELILKPAQKVKVEDIAKPRPLNIPDWCKFDDVANAKIEDAESAAQIAKLKEVEGQLRDALESMQSNLPAPLVSLVYDSIEATFASVKARCGYDPRDLLQEGFKQLKVSTTLPLVDEVNSPIFKAADELQQKIETMRQETVDLIKSVVPEEDSEKIQKLSGQCLDAVWAYISVPNENNAKQVFELGNACPNQIEGLLASVAFWSYGSLTPESDQVVKTPAGLMANGINGLLVKCATSLGGVYKPVERFERYFNLAFAALTNKSTWESYIARNTSPHQELQNDLLHFIQTQAPSPAASSSVSPSQSQPQSAAQSQPTAQAQSTAQATAQKLQPSAPAQRTAPTASKSEPPVAATVTGAGAAITGVGVVEGNSAFAPQAPQESSISTMAASASASLHLTDPRPVTSALDALKGLAPSQVQGPSQVAVAAQSTASVEVGSAGSVAHEATASQWSQGMESTASSQAEPFMPVGRRSLNTRWRATEAESTGSANEVKNTDMPSMGMQPQTQALPAEVQAQKRAAEREMQERLAQVRASFNKRFRG